jgi:hypothetical protein
MENSESFLKYLNKQLDTTEELRLLCVHLIWRSVNHLRQKQHDPAPTGFPVLFAAHP